MNDDGGAPGPGGPGRAGALSRVVDHLACPVCRAPLTLDDGTVRCAAGHAFDVARQGHVTLLGGRRAFAGDDAAMVAAREAFLARRHYGRLAHAVAEAVGDRSGLCVDLAGGTGYYLAAVVADRPHLTGLVLDASTPALKRAARAHERVAAVGADVWQALPLLDDAADVVLSVFGPRNVPEIRRVLAPGGRFVVATPTPRHLHELVEPLGLVRVGPEKESRLAAQLAELAPESSREIEYRVPMSRHDVLDEVAMGPSSHHVAAETLQEAVADLPDPVDVTVSVTVRSFRAPVGD
ncbi:methyltransferase domain-containing protein [Georgenia halophila]|uniref:Methyltransferase domain-containing protein n=1 Tax=Georgenia halophila TaxID=620889 RepID=A0ABP8L1R5_9MICO